jgi:hypothetical protein
VILDPQFAIERRCLRHITGQRDRGRPIPDRVDAADQETAGRRAFEADPRLEERRLPRAVWPDERRDAALVDREIEISQRPAPQTVSLAEVGRFEDRRHPLFLHIRRRAGCRGEPSVGRHVGLRQRSLPDARLRDFPGPAAVCVLLPSPA